MAKIILKNFHTVIFSLSDNSHLVNFRTPQTLHYPPPPPLPSFQLLSYSPIIRLHAVNSARLLTTNHDSQRLTTTTHDYSRLLTTTHDYPCVLTASLAQSLRLDTMCADNLSEREQLFDDCDSLISGIKRASQSNMIISILET